MFHSEQKWAHFCSEWSILGHGTGAFSDLWIRSILSISVHPVLPNNICQNPIPSSQREAVIVVDGHGLIPALPWSHRLEWPCLLAKWVDPARYMATPIARFMGPTWGPSGTDRNQVGPMLAPWTLLSGNEPATKLSLSWVSLGLSLSDNT